MLPPPQSGLGHLLKLCNHLLMVEGPELRLQTHMLLQCPSSWKCPFGNPVHASMGTSPLDYHGAFSVLRVLSPQLLWPDVCLPTRDTFPSINPSPRQTIMAGQVSEPRGGEVASKTPGTHVEPIWFLLGSLPIRLCLSVPT